MPTYVKTNFSNKRDMIQSLNKKIYKISNKVITTIYRIFDQIRKIKCPLCAQIQFQFHHSTGGLKYNTLCNICLLG